MRTSRTLVLTGATLVAAASLTACGADASADDGASAVTVVASTNVWGDVAAQVGGDLVEVTSVISDPGQDPHSFEPDAETLLAVSKADVVIANGGGYDDFVDTMVDSSGSEAAVLHAFDISGKADAAPEGAEVNEHVWYDVPTVAAVADQIATRLGEADPDHAETYQQNADDFGAQLDALSQREDDLRDQVDGEEVAFTEPLPVYLMEALGLEDATPEEFGEAIEEGEDVPVAVLQDMLETLKSGDVRALLYNDQVTGPVTEQVKDVAATAGVPVVPITETLPEGTDYLTWMSDNLDAVGAALTER